MSLFWVASPKFGGESGGLNKDARRTEALFRLNWSLLAHEVLKKQYSNLQSGTIFTLLAPYITFAESWVEGHTPVPLCSTMVFLSFLAFICLLPLAFSAPGQLFERLGAPSELDRRAGTFFSNWREGGGNFQCNNLGGGTYTTNWSGQGGFVCGLGYNPGGNR
jgi:hypothetical protein